MTKLRSDSTLAQLTEDQRNTLYEWIEEHSFDEAMILAAKAAPDGFALTFHKTTLQRWFQQERKHRNLQDIAARAAAMDPSTDPFEAQSKELTQLIAAAKSEFAHAIYELAQAATDPENFDRLQRSLHQAEMVQIKRQELKFKENELALARDRFAETKRQFNFNGARAALKYAIAFKIIAKDDSLDCEDKIWAAGDITFGTSLERPAATDPQQVSNLMKPTSPSQPAPADAPAICAFGPALSPQSSVLGTEAQRAPKHAETRYAPTPTNEEYLPPFSSLPSLECTDPNPAAENTQKHTNGPLSQQSEAQNSGPSADKPSEVAVQPPMAYTPCALFYEGMPWAKVSPSSLRQPQTPAAQNTQIHTDGPSAPNSQQTGI